MLRDLRDEAMLDEVRWGTQNFHALAYVAMRGLALLGVFLPVALVTGWSLLRRSPFRGPGAGWRWLVLAWLAVCLALAVVGVARLLRACWRHFRAVEPLGTLLTLTGWGGERRTRRSWRLEVVLRALVFAAAAASFLLSVWLTWQIVHLSRLRVTFPLFLYRASRLDSGVSPLVPLLLAAAGFALWSTWHVRRVLDLGQTTPYEEAWDEPPGREPVGATALPRPAGRWVRAIRMRLFKVVPEERGELLLLGIVAVAAALGGQIAYTLDGMIGLTAFNLLLKLSVAGSLVATCWAVVRLVSVWRALDHVLQALSETPLLPAFRRLPQRVAQLTRLTLLRSPSRDVVDTISAAQWRQMQQLFREPAAAADFQTLETVYPAVRALMASDAPPPSRRPRRLLRGRDDSFARLNRILSALWAMEPDSKVVTQIYEELKKGHSDDSTVALVRRSVPSLVRLWLRAAEEFAAVQVVDYVEWVLQQLRTLTLFLFVSLILTTALLSSYPYQPQSVAKLVFLFVLLGTVGALLYVMAALNRDDVLSAIAKTDPGRVTWDRSFIVNAVAVAVLPLLTLISSELPDWHLFKWLDPLLRVFGGGH